MDGYKDELDAQLAEEIKAQRESEVSESEGQGPTAPEIIPEPVVEPTVTKEEAQVAKTFSEDYVKALRAENARVRVENRTLRQGATPQAGPQGEYNPQQQGQYAQPVYDPRVDDMLLANKLSEIKADPYFGGLFSEADEEGRTFEERLLERAVDEGWPIAKLHALAFDMEKDKVLGRVKQKGIDEAYKSISSKAQNSVDKNVSSSKNIEDSEVGSIDDAIKKAMKEHGVTNLSEVELR